VDKQTKIKARFHQWKKKLTCTSKKKGDWQGKKIGKSIQFWSTQTLLSMVWQYPWGPWITNMLRY